MSPRRSKRQQKGPARSATAVAETPAPKVPNTEAAAPPRRNGRVNTAKAWRSGWAAFSAFCTIAGLVAFWPRLTLSMVTDPEQKQWLYVVSNDSFFSITDVTGDCTIPTVGVGWQGGAFSFANVDAFEPQHRRLIRSSDAHTFRCPTFSVENPPPKNLGTVDVTVTYHYARLLKLSERACYQLEPDERTRRIWVRYACS